MTGRIIINTAGEERALIPDKWVLGNGLSTDGLYIMHTNSPLLIIKYHSMTETGIREPSIVYVNGDINPASLTRLFAEAWQILEDYHGRQNKKPI